MAEPVDVRNAADRVQVRDARDRAKFDEVDRYNAIRATLATAEGRRAIFEWCVSLGLFRSVFSTSSQIYHAAGMQDAARRIWQDCEAASLELVELMQREALTRQKAELAERTAARSRERR